MMRTLRYAYTFPLVYLLFALVNIFVFQSEIVADLIELPFYDIVFGILLVIILIVGAPVTLVMMPFMSVLADADLPNPVAYMIRILAGLAVYYVIGKLIDRNRTRRLEAGQAERKGLVGVGLAFAVIGGAVAGFLIFLVNIFPNGVDFSEQVGLLVALFLTVGTASSISFRWLRTDIALGELLALQLLISFPPAVVLYFTLALAGLGGQSGSSENSFLVLFAPLLTHVPTLLLGLFRYTKRRSAVL